MKLAIISDVHDNVANLKIVLDFLRAKKIKHLICAGDLASQETFDFLKQNYRGKFYYVFGNAEEIPLNPPFPKGEGRYPSLEKRGERRFKIFAESGEFSIDNLEIAVNHFPGQAKKMAENSNYDLIFYGHTHRPWEEKIGHARLINPGNVAGLYYEPTFAVYDTKSGKSELVRLRYI